MRIEIDTDARELITDTGETLDLYCTEAFSLISRLWLRTGWSLKYPYSFSWLGRPIIQLPEDMIRIQEVIYDIQPDVIVETGVAHGGSLVFYASLAAAIGRGRIIGVDVEIRPHNRRAIEQHELSHIISLVEGNSADPATLMRVKAMIGESERVLVVLDSNHTRAHVLAELKLYSELVTPGSYIVATDGIMRDLSDVPRGRPEWKNDNPCQAVTDFLASNPGFELQEPPPFPFNEGSITDRVTHWPNAFLRRSEG